MKKTISVLVCIVMLVGLAACSVKNNPIVSDSADVNEPSITANNVTDADASNNPAIIESNVPDADVSKKPAIIESNVTDSEDMMEVESPIGILYYPKKWKDDIVFQVNDNQLVALYYDNPLFTLYFGGDKGILYGTVNGADIELRYEMHDLDSTHEDYETMSVMQEDINIIFQFLIQEGKLKLAD